MIHSKVYTEYIITICYSVLVALTLPVKAVRIEDRAPSIASMSTNVTMAHISSLLCVNDKFEVLKIQCFYLINALHVYRISPYEWANRQAT